MRLSSTLSLYMGRQYLQSVALVFLVVILTILIADTIELLRRASGPDKTATIETVLQMASLHIPFMAQKALPFVVLVGGIVTFAKLTRSRELVIARAAGVSVWQFLLPALVIAALLGGFFMTVVNPLASATTARFEQLDATHLRGQSSLLALSQSGIWLRQGDAESQSVIHAESVDQETMTLHDTIIFLYEEEDQFVGRIDAAEARLEDGYWNLTDALFSDPAPGECPRTDRSHPGAHPEQLLAAGDLVLLGSAELHRGAGGIRLLLGEAPAALAFASRGSPSALRDGPDSGDLLASLHAARHVGAGPGRAAHGISPLFRLGPRPRPRPLRQAAAGAGGLDSGGHIHPARRRWPVPPRGRIAPA